MRDDDSCILAAKLMSRLAGRARASRGERESRSDVTCGKMFVGSSLFLCKCIMSYDILLFKNQKTHTTDDMW